LTDALLPFGFFTYTAQRIRLCARETRLCTHRIASHELSEFPLRWPSRAI
jgi:hypothetical protein